MFPTKHGVLRKITKRKEAQRVLEMPGQGSAWRGTTTGLFCTPKRKTSYGHLPQMPLGHARKCEDLQKNILLGWSVPDKA